MGRIFTEKQKRQWCLELAGELISADASNMYLNDLFPDQEEQQQIRQAMRTAGFELSSKAQKMRVKDSLCGRTKSGEGF